MSISDEQLAVRAGASVSDIRRLLELGILPRGPLDESLTPRVRLALELESSGVSLGDVAGAIADGKLSLEFADRVLGRPAAMLPSTQRELFDELGVSQELFAEIQVSLGMPIGVDEAQVRSDDADVLRLLSRMAAIGVDEKALGDFFHVLADHMRGLTQAAREMWEQGVEEPMRAAGMSTQEILDAESEFAPESQLVAERMLQLIFNRFIEDVIVQAGVEAVEIALDEAGVARRRDPKPPAIAFLDLSGYTELTDRAGDETAASQARKLVHLIRRATRGSRGRLVKVLGDGAMLHFQDPVEAVRCGLDLARAVPEAGLPPARLWIDAGPLISRDADYFGRTVNVAARLADYARPREVLVTGSVAEAAVDSPLAFREIGPVRLKGVAEPVTVHAAEG